MSFVAEQMALFHYLKWACFIIIVFELCRLPYGLMALTIWIYQSTGQKRSWSLRAHGSVQDEFNYFKKSQACVHCIWAIYNELCRRAHGSIKMSSHEMMSLLLSRSWALSPCTWLAENDLLNEPNHELASSRCWWASSPRTWLVGEESLNETNHELASSSLFIASWALSPSKGPMALIIMSWQSIISLVHKKTVYELGVYMALYKTSSTIKTNRELASSLSLSWF
jgi:hypothetical protein